jgi:ADP-ribose pyrophosphatase YjhB (NUDIX family)
MVWKFCPTCGGDLEPVRRPFIRLLCKQCGAVHYLNPKVGVALLIASDQDVLMVRRREPPLQGYWTLPSGYVEYEESCEAAAIREGCEELSVEPRLIRLHGVYSYEDDPRSNMVLVVYIADVERTRLQPGSDVSEIRLFRWKELPDEVAFQGNRRAMSDFLSQNGIANSSKLGVE